MRVLPHLRECGCSSLVWCFQRGEHPHCARHMRWSADRPRRVGTEATHIPCSSRPRQPAPQPNRLCRLFLLKSPHRADLPQLPVARPPECRSLGAGRGILIAKNVQRLQNVLLVKSSSTWSAKGRPAHLYSSNEPILRTRGAAILSALSSLAGPKIY